MKVEYKVREVTRYIVTRYEETDDVADRPISGCSSSVKGEFDNSEIAYQVAYALCKQDHEFLGYPVGDERIIYPQNNTQEVKS